MKKIRDMKKIFIVLGILFIACVVALFLLAVSGISRLPPIFGEMDLVDVIWYIGVGLEICIVFVIIQFIILWRIMKKSGRSEMEELDFIKISHEAREETKELRRDFESLKALTYRELEKIQSGASKKRKTTKKSNKKSKQNELKIDAIPPVYHDIKELKEINEIGKAQLEQLKKSGILLISDLLSADLDYLAKKTEMEDYFLKKWRSIAELLLIRELDARYADILVKNDVRSIAELSRQNGKKLMKTMNSYINALPIGPIAAEVTQEQTDAWIKSAKKMKREYARKRKR